MTSILTVTLNPAVDLSIVTDRVQPERKLRCRDPRRDPGGGGINVARVLRRFGTRPAALYPAGGAPGALLHRLLDEDGIESLPVEIAGDTRENFTTFEAETGDQYRFVLPGPEVSAAEWQACLDRIAALPAPDYVVVSGSLPSGLSSGSYGEIAGTAAGRGARVVVDTSGDALASALDAHVYLVKPNLRELSELTGRSLDRPSDWEPAAAELVELGAAEVVALSLGHRGAMLVSRELRLYAPPVPVEVESAVGAGDSFLGAMLWKLSRGAEVTEAFRYGVAGGTAALLTPGTELCWPEDVERLSGEVRLQDPRSALLG